jgi:uracil-DNA glycosylase
MHHPFQLQTIDPSWRECILEGLQLMDSNYLNQLAKTTWLPGPEKIFSAFSHPIQQINYVLFGESPYPRASSANGFAFWDAAVTNLWSTTGLSKTVNRATSLRNFIKMLLVAEGLLSPNNTSQQAIANLNKHAFIQHNDELFSQLLQRGFLLLNASLVLQPTAVKKDAKAWQPFLKHVLSFLFQQRPAVELILLGNIANDIDKLIAHPDIKRLYAEHPYNLSFINNTKVLDFFRPFQLIMA